MRAETDPRVADAEAKGTVPDIEQVKPASHTAELRSVGAMIGLRASAPSGFRDVSGMLLLGNLMNTGLLFKEILSECYILSLGNYSAGGLCWEVKGVGPADASGNHTFFSLGPATCSEEEARSRLQCFCSSKLWSPSDAVQEESAGIPTTVCFLEHYIWFRAILTYPFTLHRKMFWGVGIGVILGVYLLLQIRYVPTISLNLWGNQMLRHVTKTIPVFFQGCPWEAPLGEYRILLKLTGPDETLVRFWLQYGEMTVKTDLSKTVRQLVFVSKVKVVRHKEKTAGLRSQMFL